MEFRHDSRGIPWSILPEFHFRSNQSIEFIPILNASAAWYPHLLYWPERPDADMQYLVVDTQYFDNCYWRVIRANCSFSFLSHNDHKSNYRISYLKQIEHNLQIRLNWFQQFVCFHSAHTFRSAISRSAEFFKIDNVVPRYLFTVFDSLKSKHECTISN